MDVQMPNMDGLQASQLIRKTELNRGTPIIAVTAHALKEEKERLLSSGMDDFIAKPIQLDHLLLTIESWCAVGDEMPEPEPEPEPATIDWTLALKQTNQNEQLARQMLTALIEQLPDFAEQIQESIQAADFDRLQSTVHKLHGACCYTGVPKLRESCNVLETALKRQQNDRVDNLTSTLLTNIQMVIEQDQRNAC